MSAWQDINLKDVPTGWEILPKGTYTFAILPGSKYNDRDPGRVDFTLAVVGGEFAGKRIFANFPNPQSEQKWGPSQLARLAEALGSEPEDGEDPVAYLNRVANLHVEYDVVHKPDKNDASVVYANANLFKPRAAKQ